MSLSPYTSTLASGARADATTETYDVPTRGRRGLILFTDVTAIGNGSSFVTSAALVFPLTITVGVNDQFGYGGATTHDFIVAPGVYATPADLATAVTAAAIDEDNVGAAFSTFVLVTAEPGSLALRFTSVPTGVNTTAFSTGVEHDGLAALGITNAWTIAHTQAAGADGAYSETTSVLGVDPASGKTWTILTAAALSTVASQVLQVDPWINPVDANLDAAEPLPATVRISTTHTSDNSVTRTRSIQLVG